MLTGAKRVLRRYARDARAVAAIEFAAVFPVMLLLTLGTVEVSKYYQIDNQVVQVANMLGQMASQLPQSAKTQDVQKIWNASALIAPEAFRMAKLLGRASWDKTLRVTITNVAFTKKDAGCQTACEYEANVAWSVGAAPMNCGKLPKAPNGTKAPHGKVPGLLFMEGSALYVDAELDYLPLLGTDYFPAGAIRESAWFRARNASLIKLSGASLSSPASKLCSGFN